MPDQQEAAVAAVPAVELQPVAEGAGLAAIEEGSTDVDDDGLPTRTGIFHRRCFLWCYVVASVGVHVD